MSLLIANEPFAKEIQEADAIVVSCDAQAEQKEKQELPTLFALCVDSLSTNITQSNALNITYVGIQHNIPELKNAGSKFIGANITSIMTNGDFETLPQDLKELLLLRSALSRPCPGVGGSVEEEYFSAVEYLAVLKEYASEIKSRLEDAERDWEEKMIESNRENQSFWSRLPTHDHNLEYQKNKLEQQRNRLLQVEKYYDRQRKLFADLGLLTSN